MNLGWIAWLALQVAPAPAPAPAPDQAPQEAPAEPAVAPYPGALADGLKELADHARAGENERALELCASLLASPELGRLPDDRRARARFDVGLARALAGAHGDAVADLRAAAGLAGPGELRAKSLYAAGTARLLAAEALRVQVPEIAKKLGLEPPTPPGMIPGGPPIPDQAAPDPIELARTAYLTARTELLARLKLDWRDADTRANLELVARRLRELDEIERQRKEEQQQQQQQKQQEQQQKQQPQDQQQDQDQKQDPSEDQKPPEDQKSQQDQKPPEDGKDQPEKPPEPPKDPQDQKDQQPPKDQEGKPDPAKMEEKVLSKEEVQRLLDRLQEIEDQAQALRALLRERRRVPVERDW
jgi:hypothetical protein